MRLIPALLLAASLALPAVASAASISVFPASVELGKGDAVTFYVQLQSDDSINTVGSAVTLQDGLTFLSASDGKVISQWVEHPTYHTEQKSVSFGGIIPGGWHGEGTIVAIKVAAQTSGTYSLLIDKAQTEIYKNDGNATPEPVVFGSITTKTIHLRIVIGALLCVALLYLAYVMLRRRYRITFV